MAENESNTSNAQNFIASFTQCNIAAKEVGDQLIRGILLDSTHNMVQLINLLTLQFENLLKQIQELQGRIETINKTQQELQKKREQRSIVEESQPNNSFQNLYGIIAKFLKVSPNEMKNVIHRNITAEDPESEVKYAELLDNNKVNTHILNTLCMAYKCKLFIFNGRTKQKSYYGEYDDIIIRIFHIRNKYSIFKRKSERSQKAQALSQQKQKTFNQQQSQKKQGQSQKQVDLVEEIKKVVSQVIHDQRSNEKRRVKFTPQQQEPLSEEEQDAIYCEQCGSGPYATPESYRSHIHFKHDGKTPSKNKYHKNLRINGN